MAIEGVVRDTEALRESEKHNIHGVHIISRGPSIQD